MKGVIFHNKAENEVYIDFYFGDDLVEEYFEEYKNLLEELAKR